MFWHNRQEITKFSKVNTSIWDSTEGPEKYGKGVGSLWERNL